MFTRLLFAPGGNAYFFRLSSDPPATAAKITQAALSTFNADIVDHIE
jgi:hypothetical protein